jgi:hypothetical protein
MSIPTVYNIDDMLTVNTSTCNLNTSHVIIFAKSLHSEVVQESQQ